MAILGNLERGDEQLGTAVNPCVQMAMLGQTLEEWLVCSALGSDIGCCTHILGWGMVVSNSRCVYWEP